MDSICKRSPLKSMCAPLMVGWWSFQHLLENGCTVPKDMPTQKSSMPSELQMLLSLVQQTLMGNKPHIKKTETLTWGLPKAL